MKSKAQAGLEYLMTYGWALIIIVTIAAALFFVMAPPQNQFICTSSDPTKIIVESYNMPYSPIISDDETNDTVQAWGWIISGDPPGKMVLTNATGGTMTINSIVYPISLRESGGGCTYMLQTNINNINDQIGTDNPLIFSPSIAVRGGQKIILQGKSGTMALFFQFLRRAISDPGPGCKVTGHTYPNFGFSIKYTDYFGYSKNVDVNCTGTPPKT